MRPQHRHLLAAVQADPFGPSVGLQNLRGLRGQAPELAVILAGKTDLDAPALTRSEEERARHNLRVGIIRAQLFLDQGHQLRDLPLVVHIDEKLRVGRIGPLRSVGQQETKRTLTDGGRHMSHAVQRGDLAAHFLRHTVGLAQPCPDRHPHIDHELRPRRTGKETVLDEPEAHQGESEQRRSCCEENPAATHASHQPPAIDGVDTARERIAFHAAGLRRRFERKVTEKRRDRHRRNPTQTEREKQDDEKRARVFAGAVIGQPDRAEGQDGDGCRTEQRDRRLRHHFFGRAHPVVTALNGHQHALRDDDGVVHQHDQRDDQRPEGNALEHDASEIHGEHRSRHRDEKDRADDQPAADTHGQKQDNENNSHRGGEIAEKLADRLGHRVGLEGDFVQLHAEGNPWQQLADAPLDSRAHHDHIAAAHRGDSEAHRFLPVVAQARRWRINKVTPHRGDVLEEDQCPARSAANEQIGKVFRSRPFAGRIDGQRHRARIDPPGRHHQILFAQCFENLFLPDPQAGHAVALHFHVDHLLLHAEQLDFLHIRHEQQFAPQQFGRLTQICLAVTRTGQRIKNPVDIAEIVNDHRRTRTRRKLALRVGDLAAQLVPHLRQGVTVELGTHRHRHRA